MEQEKDMLPKALRRDQAARYRIQVQGRIGGRWSDWFEGLSITTNQAEADQTTLTGHVADQAALLGILGKLVTLNFPLVLVEHIPNNASMDPHLDE